MSAKLKDMEDYADLISKQFSSRIESLMLKFNEINPVMTQLIAKHKVKK